MTFTEKLIRGRLIKRYKRFLADIQLDSGEIVVAHCTNTGSMKSCLEKGAEVYVTPVKNPYRKTQFNWEMIRINGGWVGINTGNSNKIAFEAVSKNQISGLEGYNLIKREVKYGASRFDIFAENEYERCFIEVKNVTLKEGKYALFPDAVTTRGQKHLKTLIQVKNDGLRAVMLYIVQRSDVDVFAPAGRIDPDYKKCLKEAFVKGVEILAIQVSVSPKTIELDKILPVEL